METKTNAQLIKISSACGLHCQVCSIYIGTREDMKRLEFISSRMNVPVEVMKCNGCRSEKRAGHCQQCSFLKCIAEKNIDYCGQCDEYPCETLEKFKQERPHRMDLYSDTACLLSRGIEIWNKEVLAKYTCSKCGTINSAYDIACRHCGERPSSAYVAKYEKEILAALNR
ncbi:MAG: DUF3795 domain-containing protein [Lentimicrobiaceae bacterium]|nr:DUF3795 domain-containing protein [Lentimicrobiaceae bacterium]